MKKTKSGLNAVIRIKNFGVYNCACGIFSHMEVVDLKSPGKYVDPAYCKANKQALLADFIKYMENPASDSVDYPAKEIQGVIAHYKGYNSYTVLPFWVFHDNVLSDAKDPWMDTSALMSYLYHHQEEFPGLVIVRSHMADNYYHAPPGSNPGRVYVMTPPRLTTYKPGANLSSEHKKNLRSTLAYANVTKEDKELLKSLA